MYVNGHEKFVGDECKRTDIFAASCSYQDFNRLSLFFTPVEVNKCSRARRAIQLSHRDHITDTAGKCTYSFAIDKKCQRGFSSLK